MKLFQFLFFIAVSPLLAQVNLSHEEALRKLDKIHQEFKTSNIDKGNEKYPEAIIKLHSEKFEVFNYIDDPVLKLLFYNQMAYDFDVFDLENESFRIRKLFWSYFEKYKDKLKPDEISKILSAAGFNYSQLALDYAEMDSLKLANRIHLRNIKFTRGRDSLWYSSALCAYGYFNKKYLRDLDRALEYFYKAKINMPSVSAESIFEGSIDRLIADTYLDFGELEKAQNWYYKNFIFYKNHPHHHSSELDWPQLISAGSQYIQTSLKLNEPDSAHAIIPELEKIIREKYSKYKVPASSIEFYDALQNFQLYKGNLSEAIKVQKKRETILDSLYAQELVESKRRLKIFNASILSNFRINARQENLAKENQIKRQRLIIWLFTSVLAIISIVFYSLFDRRKKKIIISRNELIIKEQVAKLEQIKNEKLQKDIESKRNDLVNLALNISLNQEWTNMLSMKMEEIKDSNGRRRSKLLNELELLINDKIKFEQDSLIFKEKLDNLSESFYRILIEKFPDLTKTDIRLCSLIRLRLESHEIALIQNISIASLNSSRYRLRKKMNLKPDKNLDVFIQKL